jgi:uncharacterized membrane protein
MTIRNRNGSTLNSRVVVLFILLFGAILPALGAAPAQSIGAAHKIFHWRPFLAPFHAVVLHFPIGFITVVFILEIYRLRRPTTELRHITMLVTWLSLVTGIISAAFGLLRAGNGGYEVHALDLHRAFGLCVPLLILPTLAAQYIAYRHETIRGWTYCYRSLLVGTLALIVVAGHLGGNLTHGSNYLVENAPEFVRELIAEDPAPTSATSVVLNENQRYYADKVQPILAAKCYNCHGNQKQKGGYRLDQPEIALKGGESGKIAIKPSDPLESQLVRLILLPRSHDDVMPPDGKESLTPEEVGTVIQWIRDGAHFSERTVVSGGG